MRLALLALLLFSFSANAAITVIGTGTYATGTGNLTPTLHASTQEGDLLISHNSKTSLDQTLACSSASGWDVLYQHSGPETTAGYLALCVKIAGPSEGFPTFTAVGVSAGSSQVLTLRSDTGWDLLTLLNQSAEVAAATDADIPTAAITPTVDNTFVIFAGKRRDGGTGGSVLTNPTGTTAIGEVVSPAGTNVLTAWAYLQQSTATAISASEFDLTGMTTGTQVAASIAAAIIDDTQTTATWLRRRR